MSQPTTISRLSDYVPAVVSGFFLTLCFPDTSWSLMAFVALVPWLASLGRLRSKSAFFSGFVFGMTHFLTLIYWIVPTVHIYGRLHIILSCSILVLLCLYLSLYPAVFGLICRKTIGFSLLGPFWAACLWVILEYLRTFLFTGFPWGVLGYSQSSIPLLIQMADLTGVLGVSFIIVFVNYSLCQAGAAIKDKRPKSVLFSLIFSMALLLGAAGYGKIQTRAIALKIKDATCANIAVIQGNIEQDVKWTTAFKKRTVEKYTRLSKSILYQKPDLIIWPETALPFYYDFDRELSDQVDRTIRQSNTYFLVGSPAFERSDEELFYFNRAYMINRFSLSTGTYDKHHLVPFGEYVPFGKYLTFLGKITAQAGNFSPGRSGFIPLEFKDHKTGVLICFEILFPSISAQFTQNGADMLTTLTNDAWFGRTSAARQHYAFAILRAVENRRSVARAANTGISGFIDPLGKCHDTTGLFTDQAVVRCLPTLNDLTFYTQYPDLFPLTCLIAFCLFFMIKNLNKKLRRDPHEHRT